MGRQYDPELVRIIREKQYPSSLNGVALTMKPIPDCDIDGAIDTRLYQNHLKEQKKLSSKLMRFIPRRFFVPPLTLSMVKQIRKPFDSIDSTPITTKTILESEIEIQSFDETPLKLKVFKSEDPLVSSPILYFIHGGGFFAGRTAVIADAMRYLVEISNYIVVSVEYRLAPEHPYPKGHKDAYEGLKWVYEHAESLGGHKDKIVVGGDSAGGNLAMYCSNRNLEENLDMIRGQILLYPSVNMADHKDSFNPYDIESLPIYKDHEPFVLPLIRGFGGAMPIMASLLNVKETDTVYLSPYVEVSSKLPPTLMSSGEHDYLTLESLALAAKMRDQGVSVQYNLYKGLPHAYLDRIGYLPQSEDCVIDMKNFIQEVC